VRSARRGNAGHRKEATDAIAMIGVAPSPADVKRLIGDGRLITLPEASGRRSRTW
jgi:hypothetical protein